MELNYADIILFLTDYCNIQGSQIADSLNIDATLISRIKNNKKNMSASITPDSFFTDIFMPNDSLTNSVGINKLYDFLSNRDSLNESIEESYNNYKKKKDSENAKAFIISVLQNCSYKSHITQDIKLNKDNLNPTQRFSKFKNPLTDSIFFGRNKMMDSIRSMLINEGTCIIYGIGGLGKSYCSLFYAMKYENDYSQIQQVIFSTDIKNTILKISFDNIDESHLTEEERLENRFSILSSFENDTLLIIDNMDCELIEEDRKYYERLKSFPLHIIFTSRETRIDSEKYLIPIQPLEKEDQLALFEHYGGFKIKKENLEDYYRIFDMVEGHTLLLELIAKTMAAEALTPKEMEQILYSPEYDDYTKVPIEKDNTYQQEKMNNFVSKLFDTSNLSDTQKNIMMHLSLTSVGGIRQRTFKKLLNCENSDINALIGHSFIIQNIPGEADTARIHLHPVIKSAVIRNTAPSIDKCNRFIIDTNAFLKNKGVINSKSEDYMDLCEILANANRVFDFSEKNLELLIETAHNLWDNLFFTDSYYSYCLVLKILSSSNSCNYSLMLQIQEKAGEVAVRLANYNDAVSHYHAAIDIITHNKLDEYSKQASLYDKLGVVKRKASQYEEALDYFTKANNIINFYHIEDKALLANIYNDMGVIFINLDNYEKAIENYQKALELRESLPTPNEKDIAYSYHNIGTVYQRQKEYDKAIEWHEKALEIRKRVYKENDPIIAASLTMLGNDYTKAASKSKKYHFRDAYDYFEQGLNIRKSTLGETHPDTAWSFQSIGDWYFYQKKYDQALEQYNKCYSIRKTILHLRHAYIGEILYKIGKTYLEMGQKSDAKKFLSEAYDIQNDLGKINAKKDTLSLLEKCK